MIAKGSQNVDTKFDIDPADRIDISGKRPSGILTRGIKLSGDRVSIPASAK